MSFHGPESSSDSDDEADRGPVGYSPADVETVRNRVISQLRSTPEREWKTDLREFKLQIRALCSVKSNVSIPSILKLMLASGALLITQDGDESGTSADDPSLVLIEIDLDVLRQREAELSAVFNNTTIVLARLQDLLSSGTAPLQRLSELTEAVDRANIGHIVHDISPLDVLGDLEMYDYISVDDHAQIVTFREDKIKGGAAMSIQSIFAIIVLVLCVAPMVMSSMQLIF